MSHSVYHPYHLQQLAYLCNEYPLDQKVVFVPTRRIGHKLSAALAKSGQSWVNLHLTTPYAWAKRHVEAGLRREGWRELSAGADLLIIEELVRRVGITTELSPDTLARAAAVTLPALRLAGIEGADLQKIDGPEELRRVVAVLETQYSEYLEHNKLYDEAEVYGRALAELAGPPAGDFVCGILDEVELSGLAYEYVSAMRRCSRDRLFRIGRDDYGTALSVHAAGRRFPEAGLAVPIAEGRGVGPGGFLWQDGSPSHAAGSLYTHQVLGTANEIRSVLRQMQQEEIPWDAVELVYTSEADHLRRIYSLLTRYEIRATFSGGLPVEETNPGRALALFYDWIESNFDPSILIRLLSSGALRSINSIDPKKAASVIRRAQPGRGEDQYFTALGRLEQQWKHDDSRSAEELDDIAHTRSLLRRLFALIPERESSVSELIRCTETFLDVFVNVRQDTFVRGEDGETSIDEEAVETLVKRLKGLAGLVSGPTSRRRLVGQFREQISRHKVADSSPHPGYVHVSSLRAAGYTNRTYVFVIGLDQGTYPGGSREDPLLLDRMRREISVELPLRGNGPAEMNWQLVRVLGMSTGETTLICSRRQLVDDRPLHPSAAFLRACRLADRVSSQMSLLPEAPDGMVPEEDWLARAMLTESELCMALREYSSWRRRVSLRYPWLSNGRQARQQRGSSKLTPYDGVLETSRGELALNGRTLSASRLETLMTCTYRYFLKYVLDIEPVEPMADQERDRWLDEQDFGSLLHRLFRRFMQEVVRRGESVDRQRHESLMAKLLEEEVEQQAERMPPPSETARRRDMQRLRTCARIFLAAEDHHCRDYTPVDFEVGFGRDHPTSGTLGQSEPVLLELSDDVHFRLQGSIDRVDHGPDGSYAVWDYKTGSTYEFEEHDLFSGGKKLQWALYARALAEVTGTSVSRSGYFFPNRRTYGQRITQDVPGSGEIARLLKPLFRMVEEGYFLQAASRDNCGYCDYQNICGDYDDRKQEMRRKLQGNSLSASEKELLQQWNYDG